MGFTIKQAAVFMTATLAAVAQGHMLMRTPVPYGKSTLNNSPLDASGSDFPCKQRPGVYDKEGANNVMAIGQPQTLSFTGSAVHGGGSCQIALTTDLAPTKDSKWMVIKSIVGGCPANTDGNLPADPNGTGASTFQFTIPDGIAPGEYSLSWSWFNRIGNREMYQNCAPVTVTSGGGTSKRDTQNRRRFEAVEAAKIRARDEAELRARDQTSSFPNLFVCNLASINSCKNTEGMEYAFPNPGPDVQRAGSRAVETMSGGDLGGGGNAQQPTGQPTNPPQQPTATGDSGKPTGQPQQPNGNPGGPGGNPQQQPPNGNGQPGNGGNGGNFAEGASSSAPPATSTYNPASLVTPVNSAGIPVPTTPPSRDGSTNNDTGSGTTTGAQSGPCSTEGEWLCLGTSFQRCASGQWSPVMALASGMKCNPGTSANFAMGPARVKRHSHGGHFRIFDSLH